METRRNSSSENANHSDVQRQAFQLAPFIFSLEGGDPKKLPRLDVSSFSLLNGSPDRRLLCSPVYLESRLRLKRTLFVGSGVQAAMYQRGGEPPPFERCER